jgi:hypothetical protein
MISCQERLTAAVLVKVEENTRFFTAVSRFSHNNIRATTAALILSCSFASAQSPSRRPSATTSLKDKTDAELLEFVIGRREKADAYISGENVDGCARPSRLDSLWEMDPKEAALALVADYVDQREKGIVFEIDDPAAKPPSTGEVGLRWISGNEYAAPAEGVTILKYDGYDSKLLISEVEIDGRPSKEEIEKAVLQTDEHRLYRAVAQQTYEILWWLRHIRFQKQPDSFTSATLSSADDFGRFWMKPDGPTIEQAIFSAPCGQCIDGNKDPQAYAAFADTLIRRVILRSGIKRRYPVPKIGKWKPPDADAELLDTHPPPAQTDVKGVADYVERLCTILKNPERPHLYDPVMERLVPFSDPLRYRDKRIDDALIDLLHRGLQAKAAIKPLPDDRPEPNIDDPEYEKKVNAWKEKREKARAEERKLNDLWFAGSSAATKLGMHDAVEAFGELLRLGKEKTISLVPAASIAGRHRELRPQLVEYLKDNLSLEEVWRGDLRELLPQVQQLASSAPPPNLYYRFTPEQEAAQKAAVLLATWKEPDKLTKTKLDILLIGHIGGAWSIPEVLRAEFADLSKEDQLKVRNFVTWMRTVDVPWSRRYIENAFTPHTPRPDIAFER